MNIEVLREAVAFAIAEHEGRRTQALVWDQGFWGRITDPEPIQMHPGFVVGCATAACLAGNIVLQAGDRMLGFDQKVSPGATIVADFCIDGSGSRRMISERATELLGLAHAPTELFDGENDIYAVVQRAQDLAEAHGESLNLPEAEPYLQDA